MDRSILITGCSSGIGHYLAENIIKSGHKVIGLARNEPKEKYSFDELGQYQLVFIVIKKNNEWKKTTFLKNN